MPPQAAQHDAGKFYPLPSLPTLAKHFIFYSVSAFSFYLKKKTPAKEKQTQGFAPRPRERRAAVHSLCYSVGSSAHSPANALELGRVRARAACVASRPLAFSVSLFHCGAAIGSLFARVYRVVDITFSTLPLQKIKYAAPTNKAAICGSSVSINLFLVVSQKSKPPLCKGRWREAPEGLF